MIRFCLIVWWMLLYWTYSLEWPRPFDDWKNFLFYLGSGILTLYFLWQSRKEKNVSLTWPALIFILYCVVSFFSLGTPIYEELIASGKIFLWAGLAWSLTRFNEEDLDVLIDVSVVVAAMITWIAWLGLHHMIPRFYLAYFIQPIGYVAHFGDFMALHIPLAAFCLYRASTWSRKIFWGICGFSILVGLAISGTRTSIAAVIGTLLIFSFLLWRLQFFNRRRIFLGILIACGLAFALLGIASESLQGYSLSQRLKGSFSVKKLEDAIDGRLKPYLATVDMIKKRPIFGWGLGSYPFVFPEFANEHGQIWIDTGATFYTHSHNEFLNQAAETGIIGLILFVTFWLVLLWQGFLKGQLHPLMGMAGVFIAVIIWQGGTGYLFPLTRLLAALYIALILKQSSVVASFKFPKSIFSFLILITTLFVAAYHLSFYFFQKSGEIITAENDRIVYADIAHRLAPLAFEPLLQYSMLHPEFVDTLYSQFPYVPLVLFQKALFEYGKGNLQEAISLTQHAVHNAPQNTMFQDTLNRFQSEQNKNPSNL